MLGETIEDPVGVEGGGSIRGMGLIPMHTVFEAEKVQRQTGGTIGALQGVLRDLAGKEVKGYEIHMGRSLEELPILVEHGKVYGTYLHGIFDEGDVARTIAQALSSVSNSGETAIEMQDSYQQKGKAALDYRAYKESQYDALADILRQHLDMNQIKRIIGL